MNEIPSHVLAGVPAEEIQLRAIPPVDGIVVLTWYEPKPGYDDEGKPRWMAHGPFASERLAREWMAGCNRRHRAALLVPVKWSTKP